jgi:hypothetical protein
MLNTAIELRNSGKLPGEKALRKEIEELKNAIYDYRILQILKEKRNGRATL